MLQYMLSKDNDFECRQSEHWELVSFVYNFHRPGSLFKLWMVPSHCYLKGHIAYFTYILHTITCLKAVFVKSLLLFLVPSWRWQFHIQSGSVLYGDIQREGSGFALSKRVSESIYLFSLAWSNDMHRQCKVFPQA